MQACLDLERDFEKTAEWIGDKAYRALLEEVYTTPKPGLVDCYSNGAHKDMCLLTFEKSADAIGGYFVKMAEEGMVYANDPQLVFSKIRKTGMLAEKAMFEATGNVNTHKGLIFSLGILCASTGICIQNQIQLTMKNLIHMEQKMVRTMLIDELNGINQKHQADSHGEKLYQVNGVAGVRGEALGGFSSVRKIAYPVMLDGIARGYSFNQIKLQTLMELVSQVEDTNILARSNAETLLEMQGLAKNFLRDGGAYAQDAEEKLKVLDKIFIQKNVSPGGCADLLAVTIFMESVLNRSGYFTSEGQRQAR